jgi:signal transduction histidine kinase
VPLNSLVYLNLTTELRRTASLLLLIVGAVSLSVHYVVPSVVASALIGWTGEDLDRLIAAPGVLDQAMDLTRTVMEGEKLSLLQAVRHRQDGSPVSVLLVGSPFLIGGEFGGAVALYTNISELKQAQRLLRRYAVELEARDEELDAFAHTVAHDLKNPLQHRVGYADLLGDESDGLPTNIRQEALETIIATDRMRGIIGELLLLAEKAIWATAGDRGIVV